MSKYIDAKLSDIEIFDLDINNNYSIDEVEEIIEENRESIDNLNELKIECFIEIIENNNNLSEEEIEEITEEAESDSDFIDNYIKNLSDEEKKFYEDKKILFESLGTDNYSFEDILKIDNKILEIEEEIKALDEFTKRSGDYFISSYKIDDYLDEIISDSLPSNFPSWISIDFKDTKRTLMYDYSRLFYCGAEFFYIE